MAGLRGAGLALLIALAGCTGLPGAPPPEMAAEPAPPPEAPPAAEAAVEPESPFLAAQRRACLRAGGRPGAHGGGLACLHETRDAGRACTARDQCQDECLARSGTCAPVTPLYGCHEVLTAAGARMTQCLD